MTRLLLEKRKVYLWTAILEIFFRMKYALVNISECYANAALARVKSGYRAFV